MCEPTTLMMAAVAASAVSGVIGAYGAIQQGNYANKVGKYNQQMAELEAQDAQRRGSEDAAKITSQASSLKSAQRAAIAGGGIDVGYGTAADLQDQTDFFGQVDANTAKYNAGLESWRSRSSGAMARAEGRMAKGASRLEAAGTLLSTAGKVASKWQGA